MGKTIEVGRNEVWVACKPSDFVSPPETETGFVLSIELPVNESAGKRCMHCEANLAGVDPLDGGDLRLRFDIQTMSIRPCRRPRKEDEHTRLVM